MIPVAGFVLVSLMAPEPTPAAIRTAVEKSLPLLAKGAAGHAEQKSCFACHNQAFPMAAFAVARTKGFEVSDDLIQGQVKHIHDFLKGNAENYKKGKGTGGQADTAGWALYTLDNGGAVADDTTTAVVEYFLQRDEEKGYWHTSGTTRPPTQGSSFVSTFLGVRELKRWGTPEQKERIEKRIAAAREWLINTEATDTEDHVYRLRALKAAEASKDMIRDAITDLRKTQHPDGGWGQLDSSPSDPYATATALVALRDTGGLTPNSNSFRRGLAYLLRTQREDGSWFVKSRAKPFQPYYESGFPHEKNQFISISATAWATAVLAAAAPEPTAAASR